MGTLADRILLTDKFIQNMKPAAAGKRSFAWDAVVPHFGVRVTDKGAKSFMVRKRISGLKNPVDNVLGAYPALSLIDARERARDVLGEIAKGIDPKKQERERREAEAAKIKNNFEAVAKAFKKGHASKNRSGFEAERIIDLYLVHTFGKKQMGDIKRRDIAHLLDQLEAGEFKDKDGRMLGGPVMADHVLGQLRTIMNWYAARDDEFVNPIVKGMRRTKPKERQRQRILNDDEIRALRAALDKAAPQNKRAASDLYGDYVWELFRSAQRREEVRAFLRNDPRIVG